MYIGSTSFNKMIRLLTKYPLSFFEVQNPTQINETKKKAMIHAASNKKSHANQLILSS